MLEVLIGISGSGKSTYANKQIKEGNADICLSRDKLRELLFSYTESTIKEYYELAFTENEKIVTQVIDSMLKDSLISGKRVILDNTHLSREYLDAIIRKWSRLSDIKFTWFGDYNVNECISRCNNRTRTVGEEIIRSQHNRFVNLLKLRHQYDFIPRHEFNIVNDSTKRKAIVVDLDGTLALLNGRSPFNEKEVKKDLCNQPIKNLIDSFYDNGYKIILCSGRTDSCLQLTTEWLKENGVIYDEIYMRRTGDYRPDYIVKSELWEKICEVYFIELMVDDRNQVVETARSIGFTVLQINNI